MWNLLFFSPFFSKTQNQEPPPSPSRIRRWTFNVFPKVLFTLWGTEENSRVKLNLSVDAVFWKVELNPTLPNISLYIVNPKSKLYLLLNSTLPCIVWTPNSTLLQGMILVSILAYNLNIIDFIDYMSDYLFSAKLSILHIVIHYNKTQKYKDKANDIILFRK